jgi:hypothetical protein
MDIIQDRDPGDEADLVYCTRCWLDRRRKLATSPIDEVELLTDSCEECDSVREGPTYDEALAAAHR